MRTEIHVSIAQQGLSLIETLEGQGVLDLSTSLVMNQRVPPCLQWMGRLECFLLTLNFHAS